MKTIKYLVLVSFFFFGPISMAQENNRIQAGNFELIDDDDNTIITIRELIKYQEGKTNEIGKMIDAEIMFYGLDRDNNSIITVSEYTKGVDWEAAKQYEASQGLGATRSMILDAPLRNYEADQGESFQEIDSDGNHIITIKELTKYHAGNTVKGESFDAELMFNNLDIDNNRVITIREYNKGVSWETSKESNETAGLINEDNTDQEQTSKEKREAIRQIKETKRKETLAKVLARKEESHQKEQFDREEKMRLKEELQTQRNEKLRLTEEASKSLKQKVAEERRQAEKLFKLKKEAEQLAEQQQREDQLKLERENSIALAAEKKEAKQLAEEKKIDDQRKAVELETQREQARRLAEMKLRLEREQLAEERRLAEELVKQKKEAERLAKGKLEKEVRRAEELEEQRKKQAKIEEEQAEARALAIEQRENKRKAIEEEKLAAERLAEEKLAAERLAEEKLAEERLAEEQKSELELQVGPEPKEEELIMEIEAKKSVFGKRTYVIIKGNKGDKRMFKDLQEFLEFDFDAAAIDVKTVIYDNNDNISPSKVWSSLKRKYGNVVLLEQTGYNDLGESELHIKFLKQGDDAWRELGIDKCDLGSDKELDKFSKRLTELQLEKLQKQEGEEQIHADRAEKKATLSESGEEERLASEMKKSSDKKENSKIANSSITKESIDNPNAFVIIRGKEEDKKQFEDLEDHIEFDFMFAKARSKTVIFNNDQSTILNDILPNLSEENDVIILIDQKEFVGEGASKYQISINNKQIDTEWKEASSHSYNLNNRADLKQLSKKITNYITN